MTAKERKPFTTSRAVPVAAVAAIVATWMAIGLRHGLEPHPVARPAIEGPVAPSDPEAPPVRSRPRDGKVAPGAPRMLHLDPRRTNRSPFTGPSSPTIAWTFDAGGPIEATPALLDDDTILVASLGGKLHALNLDGSLAFSVDLGDRIYSSPLVTEDGIFVGSDAKRFFGLTREGKIRFRLQTQGDADTGATVTPSGHIVFAAGRMIYGIKPDGTLVFRVKTARKTFSSPAVGEDGTIYVGSQDDHVYALAEDGTLRWRTNVGADADGGPAIADDGTVYVGTDRGEVLALDPQTGAIRWRQKVHGFVRGSFSVGRDGTIFAGTYGPTPRLVALEPEDGAVRFEFPIRGTGALEFGIHGGPVEDAQGRLYFGAQDDYLYALAPDGSLLFKLKTAGDIDASPVILPDGTLLVGSADGKLYAIRDGAGGE